MVKILKVTPITEPMPEGAADKYRKRIGSLRRKGVNSAAPWKGGREPKNVAKDRRRHASWNAVRGNDQSRNANPTPGKPCS